MSVKCYTYLKYLVCVCVCVCVCVYVCVCLCVFVCVCVHYIIVSCIHGYWAGTEEYRGASRGRSLEGELKPGRCGWSGDLQCGRGYYV